MKARFYIIYLLLLTLCSSCVDDFFDDMAPQLTPGTPVELTLGLSIPESRATVTASRANPDTELNSQVYDLYLFFFDDEPSSATYGRVKSKFYFASIDAAGQTQCDPALSTNGSALIQRTGLGAGEIRHIHTTAGQTRIVGVANVSVKGSANILSQLSTVTTFEELSDIMVPTVDRQSGLPDLESELSLMSGFYCDNDESYHKDHYTPCDAMTESHNGSVRIDAKPLSGKVWLTPVQARVTFAIDGNGALGGKFELLSWQVYNLPGQTPLFCPGIEQGATVDTKPMIGPDISTVYRFDKWDKLVEPGTEKPDADHCYGFTFFPADNHPGAPKNEISDYGQRAAWQGYNVTQDQKLFTNAPEGATYVVLRGRYEGLSKITVDGLTGGEPKEVSADVTYYIFLGHNSTTDFNDFNTYRNNDYTYVVRVKGVNEISVEVNTETENRPDAEGNISVLDSSVEMLDCHFEQRVVNFTRGQILDAIKQHTFRMIVDEPVFNVNKAKYNYFKLDNDGNYIIGSDGRPEPAGDEDPEKALQYMNWVEFYRHSDAEKTRKYIPYTNPKSTGALMDVRGFMADLLEFAYAPGDDKEMAVYTVYFDEYVYLDEQGNQRHPITGEDARWNKLVGKTGVRSFTMMGSTKFSPDHNSSYSTAGTSFQQRRMQTIYNPSVAGLERAWATESVEEDVASNANGSYPYLPYPYYGSYYTESQVRYGRQNCWKGLKKLNQFNYSDIIDPQSGLIKKVGDKCFYTECMGRNRDLNGNGVIDPEEYRWYIPSIEQLELLYIGRDGLTPEAQLYNVELERPNFVMKDGKLTYILKHYMSSSGTRIWAEEGGSTKENGYLSGAIGMRLYVRCVRDIGTDHARSSNVPEFISENRDQACQEARFQSIYEVIDVPEGNDDDERVTCRIRLSRLNNEAVRTTAERRERPGIVDTFSDSNKPFYEIEIADTIFPSVNFETNLASASATPQGATACQALGQGWRMPTLPEVIAVRWERPDLMPGNIGTRTRSYFAAAGIYQDKHGSLPGWLHISMGGRYSLNHGKVFALRCVRDYMTDVQGDEESE